MKNKELRGILALVIVTALSFGVIAGSRALSRDLAGGGASEESAVVEEYDVSTADGIESAVQTENGYEVTVRTKGYAGDIVLQVAFEQDGQTIQSVKVLEQNETETLGAKIAEPEFLEQFVGAAAPVFLPGMSLSLGGTDTSQQEETSAQENTASLDQLEGASLSDGTYQAKASAPDSNGFTEEMTMTVSDGKITSVNWDAVTEDGSKKSIMSENGEYTMTEDGLTWKEQSEALAEALIENQSLGFLTTNEEGKTDAVSGVSISVGSFISLAQQCMEQAAGISSKPVALTDGTYEAKASAPDSNGFTEQLSLTVENGAVTAVVWDAIAEDGSKKSILSENGEYTMTEDGPTWKEQSEALAQALIENQSLDFLTTDDQGKTDAVSGVSISVNSFITLASDCLNQAAGIPNGDASSETASGDATSTNLDSGSNVSEETTAEASQDGTQVDAVSGATISSTAAVTGINQAYEFLQTVR